jgi:hypothetical protein
MMLGGVAVVLALAVESGRSQEKATDRKFASAAESKTEFERVVAPGQLVRPIPGRDQL